MATQNMALTMHNTIDFLWLIIINLYSDSYPEIADGITVKTVCIRSTSFCCEASFSIEVKNCSLFYTFNLTAVPLCKQRYCFGKFCILNNYIFREKMVWSCNLQTRILGYITNRYYSYEWISRPIFVWYIITDIFYHDSTADYIRDYTE